LPHSKANGFVPETNYGRHFFSIQQSQPFLLRRLGPLPIGASKEQCCDALLERKKQPPRLSVSQK
jgi:hypothetical protein